MCKFIKFKQSFVALQCTATCNGGLRTRSVRCLDEDGVIVDVCDNESMPSPFEICNQVDCDNPSKQQFILSNYYRMFFIIVMVNCSSSG